MTVSEILNCISPSKSVFLFKDHSLQATQLLYIYSIILLWFGNITYNSLFNQNNLQLAKSGINLCH